VNLKDIRNAMYAQADYGPKNSAGADDRMNKFINRAYNLIALEAPFLFFEEILRIATQPDVLNDANNTVTFAPDITWDVAGDPMFPKGSTGATLPPNPWVIKQDAVGAGGVLTDWPTDRSWDGRVIEIQDADGEWHRNIIRTVWDLNYGPEQVVIAPGAPPLSTPATGKVISLWMPWDTNKFGAGPFQYRVYTSEYAIPDDIIEVHSMRLWKTNNSWPLQVIGQEDAERQNIIDRHTDVAKGIPRVIYRREHIQVQGPSVAPLATLSNQVDFGEYDNAGAIVKYPRWKGPEPAGQFEYVITYTWGKRDIWFRNQGLSLWNDNPYDWQNPEHGVAATSAEWTDATGRKGAANRSQAARNRYREPLYESAPSPVSAVVTATNASDTDQGGTTVTAGGPAVLLTLPNIQYMQGFMMMGTGPSVPGANGAFVGNIPPDVNEGFVRVSSRLSGWHVRIYRRRITADFSNYEILHTGTPTPGIVEPGQWVEGFKRMDIPKAFLLLAEVNVDWDNQGYFIDDGAILPDYHRRLRDTHGYQTIGMYPTPNARFELEIRCIRRPKELKDDQDAPLIHAEACDLLVDRALQLLYETEGNISMMRLAKGRYERNLKTLSKRYGDLRSSAVPMLKRLSRATPGYRTTLRYRQWWNTPNS
jgi:hypothetical protein